MQRCPNLPKFTSDDLTQNTTFLLVRNLIVCSHVLLPNIQSQNIDVATDLLAMDN